MDTNYKYKNGQKVSYKIDGVVEGVGIIRGIATTGAPVIGVGYILEDTEANYPSESYPYSHFVVFENMLKEYKD